MTAFTDMANADLAFAIADQDGTFTCSIVWKGQTITDATGSMVSRTNDVQDEGVFENRELEIVAPIGSFKESKLPIVQDTLDITVPLLPEASVKYHIVDKDASTDGVAVTFRCRRI